MSYAQAWSVQTSSSEIQSHQSTWVSRVHGSSEYIVSINKSPTLRPGQYRPVQVKLNLIRVHGSSEYMGRQSTWVVIVHGASEYMGRQSTWVVIVHGASEYMGRQSHGSSEHMVSISKCPTLSPGQ